MARAQFLPTALHLARVLPAAIDCGVCLAIDRGFSFFTRSPISPSLVRPARYPHDRARAVFGYAPRHSLEAGMADLARLCRAGPSS